MSDISSYCPLTSGLRRLLKWIEEEIGEVPEGIERVINNSIRHVDLTERLKEKMEVLKARNAQLKKYLKDSQREIDFLNEELADKETALHTQAREAEVLVKEYDKLVEINREIRQDLNARDSYCDYFNRRIQRYFGFPKEEFEKQYLDWASKKMEENSANKN